MAPVTTYFYKNKLTILNHYKGFQLAFLIEFVLVANYDAINCTTRSETDFACSTRSLFFRSKSIHGNNRFRKAPLE